MSPRPAAGRLAGDGRSQLLGCAGGPPTGAGDGELLWELDCHSRRAVSDCLIFLLPSGVPLGAAEVPAPVSGDLVQRTGGGGWA